MTTQLPCPSCALPLVYDGTTLYCAQPDCTSDAANDGALLRASVVPHKADHASRRAWEEIKDAVEAESRSTLL